MKTILITLLVALVSSLSHSTRAGDWTTVSSPSSGKGANSLAGVAAVDEKKVWAVCYAFNNQLSAYQTVIEHWDGSRWSLVRSPNATTNWNFLNAVAVRAAN